MPKPAIRKRRNAIPALVFLVLFMVTAAPCESGNMPPEPSQHPAMKTVRLQIRISEAKKKKNALRYYRSVARRQNAGRINHPAYHQRANR